MHYKTLICFFSIVFSDCIASWSQERRLLDSLFHIEQQAAHDTTKIDILIQAGNCYESFDPDSALFYFRKALSISEQSSFIDVGNTEILSHFQLLQATSLRSIGGVVADQGDYDAAIGYYLKALQIGEEISKEDNKNSALRGKELVCKCYSSIGNIHLDQGNYSSADKYFNRALQLYTEISKLSEKENAKLGRCGIGKCYINLGIVALDQGRYALAQSYFFKGLKIKEEVGDKHGVSVAYTDIGLVHSFQKDYNKAIAYYKKSLAIDESLGDKKGMSTCFTNMGNAISDLGLLSKNQDEMDRMSRQAINYYKESLIIKRSIGDKKGMSTCFTNMGSVLTDQAKVTKDEKKKLAILAEAIEYYQKSVRIDSELGDKKGLSLIYGNLSSLYLTLANSKSTQSKIKQVENLNLSIVYGKKAYDVAISINAWPEIYSSASHLKESYTAIGAYNSALKFANICLSAKDSLFSKEKTDVMAELDTRYQTEKKQLEIEKLSKEQELQKSKITKQRITFIATLTVLALLIIFASILANRLRITRTQKRIIETQKSEVDEVNAILNQQNEEIVSQRDEIEAQRDLVTSQKSQIETILRNVNQSIDYATLIQSAILPEDTLIQEYFASHFILYKPKDKVSGDFYWWEEINGHIIIAVADCTGHGVPGAFMGILGSSILSEIVQKEFITNPAEILEKLRVEIMRALKQKTLSEGQRDGIDMAIISIKKENNLLTFAGANMPLWIVRKSSDSNPSYELLEIKEDKMPVCIYERMVPFTNQEMIIRPGDTLYLFSDGYADQFGGPQMKKFSTKNFRKLLLEIAELTLVEQRTILKDAHEDWKNGESTNSDQTDDITVLGLRVK